MSEFGYTNDPMVFAKVVAWRTAAMADGWLLTSVYKQEPAESYGHIAKDGFKGSVNARVIEDMVKRYPHYRSKWKYEALVTLWGPDGRHIKVPENYDWNAIQAGVRTCDACGKNEVNTFRYAFAGRCCFACLPAMREKYEQPGWCD